MKKCDHCGESDRRQCYDSDLSDAAFAVIEPILAGRPKRKTGRPMEYPWREILNTIFYLLRTGCQWRQLPHDLVKWWVAYRWFRTLAKDGTWRVVHDELHRAVRRLDGRDDEPTACSLDAQSVQSAEGGEQIGFDKFKLRQVQTLPDANAVDSKIIPWAAEELRIDLEVVKRSDDIKGFAVIPWRWVVERTNAWVAAHRRRARDYERLVETSETMIDLAMIDVMGNRLAGGTRWLRWRTMTGPEPTPEIT